MLYNRSTPAASARGAGQRAWGGACALLRLPPTGAPVEFVSGFLKDGKARGRPVGVIVDPRGAMIVAHDVSNTIWRVRPNWPVGT